MNSTELKDKMVALHSAINELEGQASKEEDAEKKAVIVGMIEGKTAEWETAKAELAHAEKREQIDAEMKELEAKRQKTEGKTQGLTDVKVPDSDHNEANHEIQHTNDFTKWFTSEVPSQAMRDIEGKKGTNYINSITPNKGGGMTVPKWMREVVCPAPKSLDLENYAKAMHGEKMEGKDVLVRQASGDSSGGGSLVAPVFVPELHKFQPRLDDIPNRCFVKRAVGNEALFPKLTQSTNEFGVAVTWGNSGASAGEGNALSESNPVFTRVTVYTERLGLLSQASLKEVRVNNVGLEAELAWMFRGAGSRAISTAILEGVTNSGSELANTPQGINTGASIALGVNVQARQVGDQVSYTDLINTQFSVNDSVFDDGIFVISGGSSGAMKWVASLDDTAGRPVFAPEDTWAGARSPTIAGRQYINTVSNTKSLGDRGDVLYGSFMHYGLVVDTDNLSIERSDEYAFNAGLVTYRMILYVGGEPLGYDAFAVLGDPAGVSSSSSS